MLELDSVPWDGIKMHLDSQIEMIDDLIAINAEIINDTREEINGGLKLRNITDNQEYRILIRQNEQEMQTRIRSAQVANQQLNRLNQIKEESSQPKIACIYIPETIARDELKLLITLLQIKLETTQSQSEHMFLSALLQTADTCKTRLDSNSPMKTEYIPLLSKEHVYHATLTEELKQIQCLDDPTMKIINTHLKQVKDIQHMQQSLHTSQNFLTEEKTLLNNLCDNLIRNTQTLLACFIIPDVEKAHLVKGYQNTVKYLLDDTIKQSNSLVATNGFKGIINKIYLAIFDYSYYTIKASIEAQESYMCIKEKLQHMKQGSENVSSDVESKVLSEGLDKPGPQRQ
ncbi:MAG: hypothetical protein PSV35_01660 [bacterium]|nr:hypothetical protein [bacterium]